jgi:hypothetical protein
MSLKLYALGVTDTGITNIEGIVKYLLFLFFGYMQDIKILIIVYTITILVGGYSMEWAIALLNSLLMQIPYANTYIFGYPIALQTYKLVLLVGIGEVIVKLTSKKVSE